MWNAKASRWIKPAAGLLILGGLTWAGAAYDLPRHTSVEEVRSMVQSLGAYGAVTFVGLCTAAVLLHIPEIVLIAIGGVLFGAVNGFLLGWIGSVAGSTCSFLIARYFMRDAVRRHCYPDSSASRPLTIVCRTEGSGRSLSCGLCFSWRRLSTGLSG